MTCYMTFTMFQSTLQEYCAKLEIGLATVSRMFLLTGLTTLGGLLCAGNVTETHGYPQLCIFHKHPLSDLQSTQVPCDTVHTWKCRYCPGSGISRSPSNQGCLHLQREDIPVLCGSACGHRFLPHCDVNILPIMFISYASKERWEHHNLSDLIGYQRFIS